MPLDQPADPLRTLPAGTWPRTYRPSLPARLLLAALGAALAAGGLLLSVHELRAPAGVATLSLVLIGLLLSGLGAAVVALVVTWRLVLHADRLELLLPWGGPRLVRRAEISGRRIIPIQRGTEQLVLELRTPGARPLKTTLPCARDAAFDAWLAIFPDLEAEELRRARAALLADAALGPDEAARLRTLARAHRTAWVARVAAFGSAGWAWLYPRPYGLLVVVLTLLPLAALWLVLSGRGVYSVEGLRKDPRPELLSPILVPGLALGLRALLDVNLLEARSLLPWALGGGLAMAALLAAADARLRQRWWMVPLLAALLASYPWGAFVEADVLLDGGEGESHFVRVLARRVERNKVTSYHLDLTPWGPLTGRSSATVSRELHDRVRPGGVVCVALHPGALGLRWFVVDACP
jgi:hypothetical protein